MLTQLLDNWILTSFLSWPHRSKDKWFNTGGIKSASDRFDPVSGFGLRKRYGKVVRQDGLPVLKFQEFSLLRKSGETLDEDKKGPSLFHIMEPGTKRGAQLPAARLQGAYQSTSKLLADLGCVRRQMRELQAELAAANETITQQQQELHQMRRGQAPTRRRKSKVPHGCR